MNSRIKIDFINLLRNTNWHNCDTYQARISNNLVRWIKVGNLVLVSGRFRTEMLITATSAIATGFPIPSGNTSVPLAGCTSNNNSAVTLAINAQGSLCAVNQLANATYYAVGGIYFT